MVLLPHEKCLGMIKLAMRLSLDADGDNPRGALIVSPGVQVVAPGFSEYVVRCPHGVFYWVAPDAELQAWFAEKAQRQSQSSPKEEK